MNSEPTQQSNDDEQVHWSRLREDIAVVTWSSFLVASVATMLFFAFIDPENLIEALNRPWWLPSRMSGYALGFFFFWFMSACAASMTAYMLDTSHEHFQTTRDQTDRKSKSGLH
ncbi:MAG: hypothetical protein ABUL58_05235 [Steroidobacter sp.]